MSTTEAAPRVDQAKATETSPFDTVYRELLKNRPGMLASESGGELAWLKTAREKSFSRWSQQGLPTRREERWRYTNLTPIMHAHVILAPELERTQLKAFDLGVAGGPTHSAKVVFVNGHFAPGLSDLTPVSGLSVVVLSELLHECVNQGWTNERRARFAAFQKHLETSDADRETVFASMNTSFMQDGILLQVAKGRVLPSPIALHFLTDSTAAGADLPMVSPRVFVHLEERAEASLVESSFGSGRYFSNGVTDIRLEPAARLSHCRLQNEGPEAFHVATTRIHQTRDSWCETFQFSLGAALSRQDLHVTLEGQGAEAVLDGLYLLSNKQHADHQTVVDHAVPHTLSSQLYKGILDGDSRAVFNGRVCIRRGALQSNASQLNNNLLLSARAEVNAKPELEIDADDVKASHGATIGQLDPEHIFYLEARAIPRAQAVQMLARGFAQDVVFCMKNQTIREHVREWIDQKFATLKISDIVAPGVSR